MLSLFKKKRSFEEIVEKIASISTKSTSPLEKWLHNLKPENIVEIYIYNFNYCWLYLIDHDLIKNGMEDIAYYLLTANKCISKIVPELNEDKFIKIYTDRLEMLKIELLKYRKSMRTSSPYFPYYYFGRILEYPLMDNDFTLSSNYTNGEWNSNELAGMFPHQLNFIQDNLNSLLK